MLAVISDLLEGSLEKITFNYDGINGPRHDEVVEIAYHRMFSTVHVKFYEAVYDLGDTVPIHRYTAEVCVHDGHWHWRMRCSSYDSHFDITDRHVALLNSVTKAIQEAVGFE